MSQERFYTVTIGNAVSKTFTQKRNAYKWARKWGAGKDWIIHYGRPEHHNIVDLCIFMPDEIFQEVPPCR